VPIPVPSPLTHQTVTPDSFQFRLPSNINIELLGLGILPKEISDSTHSEYGK